MIGLILCQPQKFDPALQIPNRVKRAADSLADSLAARFADSGGGGGGGCFPHRGISTPGPAYARPGVAEWGLQTQQHREGSDP